MAFAGPPSAVDAGWGGEAFGNGRVAMAMEGNWVINYLLDTFPELNWGVSELPEHPDGTQATMVFTVCYGVAADNEHPEEFLGAGELPDRRRRLGTWLPSRALV